MWAGECYRGHDNYTKRCVLKKQSCWDLLWTTILQLHQDLVNIKQYDILKYWIVSIQFPPTNEVGEQQPWHTVLNCCMVGLVKNTFEIPEVILTVLWFVNVHTNLRVYCKIHNLWYVWIVASAQQHVKIQHWPCCRVNYLVLELVVNANCSCLLWSWGNKSTARILMAETVGFNSRYCSWHFISLQLMWWMALKISVIKTACICKGWMWATYLMCHQCGCHMHMKVVAYYMNYPKGLA